MKGAGLVIVVTFAWCSLIVGQILDANDPNPAANGEDESEQRVPGGGAAVYPPLTDFDAKYVVYAQVLQEIWNDENPYNYVGRDPKWIDAKYPSTNLESEMIRVALTMTPTPVFWLEIGSMLGGSAIRTATTIKEMGLNCSVICIDPFTGDANMLAWEHKAFIHNEWRYLHNERGRPRIYDRFMANVVVNHHYDVVMPILASSIVGMRVVKGLYESHRIQYLPQVLYLDSAHDEEETKMELRIALDLLPPGGILMGDDWNWGTVADAVRAFAVDARAAIDSAFVAEFERRLPQEFLNRGEGDPANVVRYKWQWALRKL